jgi:anti-anti-sigma factor
MARILLIEDSITQAAQFVMMLEPVGFEVETSNTLASGLERLKRGGIDALLLDLNLPDSEGLATFQTACSQAGRIPIVVLTHVDDEDLASKTLQQGAQDYLVKGEVNANWLCRSIRHAIARGRSDSARQSSPEMLDVRPRSQVVVEFESIGDVTIAHVNEKQLLDARVISELSEYLLRRVGSRCSKMVISFAQVEYVSNGAIGVLLALRRRMLSQNGRLFLCDLRESVAEQFTTRQFHRLFEVFPNADSAMQGMAAFGSATE